MFLVLAQLPYNRPISEGKGKGKGKVLPSLPPKERRGTD